MQFILLDFIYGCQSTGAKNNCVPHFSDVLCVKIFANYEGECFFILTIVCYFVKLCVPFTMKVRTTSWI